MQQLEHILPHVNASLNAIATVLLVVGFALIKRRRETAHKWTMLSCFGVSVLFFCCYLFYHIVVKQGESTKFPTDVGNVRYAYYAILISHIILAALVPFLAITTIYLGLRDRRAAHRRLARITFPIWLYVSVTGVGVYLMLYHMYSPERLETRAQVQIERQTKELPSVTRIELFTLGKTSGSIVPGEFPIRPYSASAPVSKRVFLTESEAQEIADLWRRCEFGPNMFLCHYPAYGMRCFAGERMVLETSLCWDCTNCYLKVHNDHRFMTFVDEDSNLFRLLEHHLPLANDR